MNKASKAEGCGYNVPPVFNHVLIYFDQKGMTIREAEAFFNYQNMHNWKTDFSRDIRNWKIVANEWIWNIQNDRNCSLNRKMDRY